jgi:hypothetical protein
MFISSRFMQGIFQLHNPSLIFSPLLLLFQQLFLQLIYYARVILSSRVQLVLEVKNPFVALGQLFGHDRRGFLPPDNFCCTFGLVLYQPLGEFCGILTQPLLQLRCKHAEFEFQLPDLIVLLLRFLCGVI